MVKFTLEVDRSREFGVPNPTTIIKKIYNYQLNYDYGTFNLSFY
jgi:hypothetical protein